MQVVRALRAPGVRRFVPSLFIMFIDYARIHVQAGSGGNGCCSFRREKNVPRGGPDGGHGGNGGHIVLQVDAGKRTLLDFRYNHFYRAKNGTHGLGKDMHGKNAADLVIRVPSGTIVRDQETGVLVADMVSEGQSVVISQGGRGGRGNTAFSSSINRAPRRYEEGHPGEERSLELELKLLADVGLVGHPNAGKSTLLARLSAAKPKIANYPFTTLEPNLGIVKLGDYDSFVLADIPGLIEGAHDGKGLGHQFLKHIERTRILLFLLDASQPDPWGDYHILVEELRQFNETLLDRPAIMVFSKLDILTDQATLAALMEKSTPSPMVISSVTGEGLPELLHKIQQILYEIDAVVSD